MINEVPKCVGETEEYAYGYESGLRAGIYNTLVYMENNGYFSETEFWKLKEQIHKDNKLN